MLECYAQIIERRAEDPHSLLGPGISPTEESQRMSRSRDSENAAVETLSNLETEESCPCWRGEAVRGGEETRLRKAKGCEDPRLQTSCKPQLFRRAPESNHITQIVLTREVWNFYSGR